MILFYTFLAAVAVFGFLHQYAAKCNIGSVIANNIEAYRNYYKSALALFSVWMVIIIGLRAETVGIDTQNYAEIYERVCGWSGWSDCLAHLKSRKFVESGYWVSLFFLSRLNVSGWGVRLIFATIAIAPVMKLIASHSANYLLSLFVYLAFGLAAFSFTAIRQSVAIGFVVLAYLALEKNRWRIFALYMLFAFSFHVTAIVFTPVLFFRHLKLNKKTVLMFFVLAMGLYALRDPVMRLAEEVSGKDYSIFVGEGQRYVVFLLVTVVVQWVYRKKCLMSEEDRTLFWVSCLCVTIYSVARQSPVYMRMALYYEIFLVITIPHILKVVPDAIARAVGYIGYSLAGVYFFFKMVCFAGAITPYSFFWQ